jgi:eukaryotic-like serine/threonine-protein kinase
MATTLPHNPTAAASTRSSAPAAPRSAGPRAFGRFALLQLLGKSELTMSWLASDPRSGQEVMLAMPRVQPADEFALEVWQRDARKASRLNHPHLAQVIELGVQDHWPYFVVDRALGVTLPEWLAAHPSSTALEQVGWLCQALEGLAYAHEAGVSHGDMQPHQLLINEHGTVRVMALACANEPNKTEVAAPDTTNTMPLDPTELRSQRAMAERDLLGCGLLLHVLLSDESPLNESDFSRAIQRMPPLGRELLRLPWTTPVPVSEALRAIANRAVASQPRQRYLNARTFLRALQGWCEVAGQDDGGPLVLLLDRLRTVGHLPAMPGVSQRVARLASMDGQHTDAIAEQILQDMALSFELLRQVNLTQVSGGQFAGSGPVLTVRRAVALLGLNGVRQCANGLRAWPGPLNEPAAAAMQLTVDRVRLAGHVAQLLRPAGFDGEMAYLVCALQNLGRLLVQYHFAEEAEQVRQLMRQAPSPPSSEQGAPELPGMTETMASLAVLGADIESLGTAVAHYWGLGEEVQHMMRRLPTHRPVRSADGDSDFLRAAASAANEAVDVLTYLPQEKMSQALTQVTQRYARLLQLEPHTLGQALKRARGMLQGSAAATDLVHSVTRDATQRTQQLAPEPHTDEIQPQTRQQAAVHPTLPDRSGDVN